VTVNHPFHLGKGSIGKALEGREIRLGPGGEILVRGENVAAGYWQGGTLQPAGEQGWLRTGDIGALDAEGNLYFKGRSKNVIVTPAGMNVYPEDLEAALRRQPEVRDCVVLGLDRGCNAEAWAVLLLKDGAASAEAAVRRANESLAEYQQLHHWVVWPQPDFPRTTIGKPRAAEIRDAVAAQLQPAATSGVIAPKQSDLAEMIKRITGRGSAPIAPAMQMGSDLGLSSLDRVELLGAIEDRYQLDLNESAFTSASTIGELEKLLHDRGTTTPTPAASQYVYPRWAQRWPVILFRRIIYYLLAWPITWLLGWPRIRGREHLRGVKGPVLIVANHVVYMDPAFVLVALPGRFRDHIGMAMGGERLQMMRHPPREWNWLWRWLNCAGYALVVAVFNVFPLPQQSGFRESFQFAGSLVDRDYSVLVFPEGLRTLSGKIGEFRGGIGLLVQNLRLPVVPVRLEGLFELKAAGRWHAPLGAIRVTVGELVTFPPSADPEVIAAELRRRVIALGSGHE
jgi:long-chain acyl-CoA synthetase